MVFGVCRGVHWNAFINLYFVSLMPLFPAVMKPKGVAQQKWGFSALFSLDIADECHWCCTFVQSLSTLTDERHSIKWIGGILISFGDNGRAGPTELIGVGVPISEHGHLGKRGSWVEHIPEPGPREHNYVSSGVMPIFIALRRQPFWEEQATHLDIGSLWQFGHFPRDFSNLCNTWLVARVSLSDFDNLLPSRVLRCATTT